MVDGDMYPTHPDVVRDTLAFTPDNKVLYAAGAGEKGDYRLYTDGKPGKAWNYIPWAAIVVGNGGKSLGMVAYTGPKGFRFGASLPVEGRTWDPGMPGVVVNDTMLAERATTFALSPVSDRAAWLAIKPDEGQPGAFSGPLMFALRDGKHSVDLPRDAQLRHMTFSPDGKHLVAVWSDSSGGGWSLYYDGKVLEPPTGYLLHVGFAKSGALSIVTKDSRNIWQLEVDPAKLAPQQPRGAFGIAAGGSTRPTTRAATGPSTRLTFGAATRPTTRATTRPVARPTPKLPNPRSTRPRR